MPCCFFKDTKTLHCSFTLFTKGQSLFLSDLLTFLLDWFLKQLPEYEPSRDLFFILVKKFSIYLQQAGKQQTEGKKAQPTNIKTRTDNLSFPLH